MGRELIFSDPRVIEMANRDFIPVVGDDWYQRRRDDAVGEFFRKVADQGPRQRPEGDLRTRQGIYFLTAAGQLLAYRHGSRVSHILAGFEEALEQFQALPPEQRHPSAVPELSGQQLDEQYHREPPEGGLIVRVHTRALEHDESGGSLGLSVCSELPTGTRGTAAARDFLWLKGEEWQALIPTSPAVGDTFPMPQRIAERIKRFHLIDNTRGEPPMWRRDEIRESEMTLTVERVEADQVVLRLDGKVVLATDDDLDQALRGFDARLLGYLAYDPRDSSFRRFDIVALGDHWGEARYVRGARPGRAPLGVAFQLVEGDEPADRIPPQAIRTPQTYWGR